MSYYVALNARMRLWHRARRQMSGVSNNYRVGLVPMAMPCKHDTAG